MTAKTNIRTGALRVPGVYEVSAHGLDAAELAVVEAGGAAGLVGRASAVYSFTGGVAMLRVGDSGNGRHLELFLAEDLPGLAAELAAFDGGASHSYRETDSVDAEALAAAE